MEDFQSILPQHAIGSNIRWWIGQIEEKDTKYSNRFKVRIVGKHIRGDREQGIAGVSTENLPWCHTMLPVTTPYSDGGTTGATANLEVGNWVMGFFLDEDSQRPIIVGSVGHVSKSTEEAPSQHDNQSGEKGLEVVADRDTNPNTMQPADSSVSPNLAGHPPGVDEKSTSALISRLNAENSETNPGGIKFCVNVADPNCGGEKDLGGQIETILGEMLKANQDSGGQLGDFLVSKATGQLYNYVNGARKYINKIFQVVKTFVARIKGEIVKKIKEGIDKLVKALLKPDSFLGDSLKTVREFVNKLLENLGCSMADITSRLQNWLTNLLFNYLYDVFKQAACQVDALVNGILNEITSLLDGVLGKILGPLSSILGAIAAPLNLIGGVINNIFKLLGISCDGPNQKCVKTTKVCVDCGAEKKKDFLDNLLATLSDGPLIEGSYTCKDANSGIGAKNTKLTFVGGSYRYKFKPSEGGNESSKVSENDLVTYTVPSSYRTREGRLATFTVTRTGSLDKASSISYKTINGTAKSGSDYFSRQGILGFAPGQSTRSFTIQILNDGIDEGAEIFYIKFKVSTGIYDSYFSSTKSNTQLTTVYILQDENSGGGDLGTEPIDVSIPPARPVEDPDDDDDDDEYQPITQNPGDDTNNPPFPVEDLPRDDDDDDDEGSADPEYAVTADKAEVGEGGVVTYTITTRNVDDGTILTYNLDGATSEDNITSADIDGPMSGTFIINESAATVQVTIAEDEDDTEENETLRFSIEETSAFADVIINTNIDSEDSSEQTYSVVANKTSIAEGETVVYTIVTTNVDAGTILSYTLSGSDITSEDIEGGQLTGTFIIDNNTALVSVTAAEDGTVESTETLNFAIDETDASVNVSIDTSLIQPSDPDPEDPDPTDPDPTDPDPTDPDPTDPDTEDPTDPGDPTSPRQNHIINLSVDKTVVKEGEFVKYTVKTQNVAPGTTFGYTLFGFNITTEDILGGQLTGQFTIDDVDYDSSINPTGSSSFLKHDITVGIAEDSLIEDDEVLIFALNGTGKQVSVLIDVEDVGDTNDPGKDTKLPGSDIVIPFPDPNPQPPKPGDIDVNDPSDPLSPDPKSPGYEVIIDEPPFKEPKSGPPVIDEDGVIIEFPIIDGGGPYVEPPIILVSGQGYGASAIALLNDRGAVAELRITNPGRGYVGELAATSSNSCVIDSYTIIRPGDGYTEQPQVFVNGEEGIAEAVIENGRVISLRVLDRTRVFDTYPVVSIIGGGGFGALFLPSFVCLDILDLERNEYAKIGTGKYIDCP